MAEIYQARLAGAQGFFKEVAIKRMHRHLSENQAVVDLFVNEARITSRLDHPNIVTVFELDECDGRLFMVMELVDGLDLGGLLGLLEESHQSMGWDVALAIAMEVTRALQFVHACVPGRKGRAEPAIHRDLSPGNIMVSRSGGVKLLDFGVAKTLLGDDDTDTIARGKWHYMSPEQVRGEQLDGRSDLFSLGAVLFELLTGQQAFKGQTLVDSMRKVEQAQLPPAPTLEPPLEELLTTLLARDRDQRYPDASVALEAMARIMVQQGSTTGERQIATLLQRLDGDWVDDVDDEVTHEVMAARDVDDQLTNPRGHPFAPGAAAEDTDDQLTNPRGDGRPLSGPVALPGPGRKPLPTPTPPLDAPRHAPADPPGDPHLPEPSLPWLSIDLEPEEEPPKPQPWPRRNLVWLLGALLAILVAGGGVTLAVVQRRAPPRSQGAARKAERPRGAQRNRTNATAPGPRARALPRVPPRTRPRTSPRLPPPRRPTPSGTVPMTGVVGKGQLDVVTNPADARVYVNSTFRGLSPLRALAPAGRRIRVALSLRGRGLYRTRLWMPAAVGRRIKIMMPFVSRPLKEARAGRTAIRVICNTAGVHRVYIDGRDTGRDCPTPPLEVLPVVHLVTLYLPTEGKTVWRKLRPKAGQTATVSFGH